MGSHSLSININIFPFYAYEVSCRIRAKGIAHPKIGFTPKNGSPASLTEFSDINYIIIFLNLR